MPARFYEQEVKAAMKDKRKLSAFLDQLVHTHLEGVKKIALNYIFCNDAYLLGINKEYLDHDTFTDIITFDLSEGPKDLTGEIYVSIERVKENAAKFKATYTEELHRVIFHGALHLCGFKDKKEADQKIMRQMENSCLQEYMAEEKENK
jgi:probable rRNA maturation factor